MDAVGKPSGLTRRKGSAAWYYRQRRPRHLEAPGVPEEVWISLGTADYHEAIKQLDAARDAAAQRFRGALRPESTGIFSRTPRPKAPNDPKLPILTTGHAAILARSFFQRALVEIDLRGSQIGSLAGDHLTDLRSELQDRQRVLLGHADEEQDDPVLGAQISVLRAAGLRSEPQSEAGLLLREYLRRAMVQLGALRLARLDGDFSDRITDGLFVNGAELARAQPISITDGRQFSLGEALDRYETEVIDLRGITDKSAEKQRSFLRLLGDHFGRNTVLAEINRTNCNQFRDLLTKLPPNFTKKRRPGQTLQRMAEANKGPTLAWETQNNYLAALSNLFEWCVRERLLPDNVAKGIAPLARRKAAEKARLPFNAEELAQVFAQPIFTGCKDDERGFATPGPNVIRRSRYWLPLVALFSGMRMEEILQMTPDHVRLSPAGNPFIVLTRDMKLKTESAQREIPIHPMLIRLGFVDWAKGKGEQGVGHLFDDVPISKHGYRSDTFSKRFATFLRKLSFAADRRPKLCFHSLRHNFKDALNRAEAPELEMEEICGWSRGKKTSRRYGSGLNADRLKPYVDQVSYDFDLSHLLQQVAR